jgi:hypothetical protein
VSLPPARRYRHPTWLVTIATASSILLLFVLAESTCHADVFTPTSLTGFFETPNYSNRKQKFRYPNDRDDEWRFHLQKGTV